MFRAFVAPALPVQGLQFLADLPAKHGRDAPAEVADASAAGGHCDRLDIK